MRYIVGIDVGQSGIGKAAIEIDENDFPVRILNSVVTIIDGGKDPSTGKTPQSRLAVSGVARRTRRLHQRKAKRIRQLDEFLQSHGIVPLERPGITYEPWHARAELIGGYVEDETRRSDLLHLAIMHMARHRGWRNPWWSYNKLASAPTPTDTFQRLQQHAAAYFNVPEAEVRTVGLIGSLSTDLSIPLRDRSKARALAKQDERGAVIAERIMQEDQLAELREILEVQRVPTNVADQICQLVFKAEKPTIAASRVGRDPLPGQEHLPRAPRSALEFQEYRIRQAVTNLRIKVAGGDTRALTPDERELVFDKLWTWSNQSAPTWAEVADWLDIEEPELRAPTSDELSRSHAPINRTAVCIKDSKAKVTKEWWDNFATAEQRSQFAAFLGDSTDGSERELIEDFISELPEDELETLDSLPRLESGRASYSIDSLRKLNAHMASTGQDLSESLQAVFGVSPNWKPKAPKLQEQIGHPTVDRILIDIGRWLENLVRTYGVPERVVVEHVRSAFMGPAAKQELIREQAGNKRRREEAEAAIRASLNMDVRRPDVRKQQSIQMQNGKCLYCGSPISFTTAQMDHIVPRAAGGSNRLENLVAVCEPCNRSKGKMAFGAWAAIAGKSNPEISVAAAQARVRGWNRPNHIRTGQFNSLKKNTSLRLRRTSNDDPLDERSMETTAYAAREIRYRIQGFLQDAANDPNYEPTVEVYQGRITSEARKAAGVDRQVTMRGGTKKTRFDRRHHAIDAAIVATLRRKVAEVLAQRSELQQSAQLLGDDVVDDPLVTDWKQFSGFQTWQQELFDKWQLGARRLAELLDEAMALDTIPVIRPLRLGPNVGRLHADTIEPLVMKSAAEAFTEVEVLNIVDPAIYEAACAIRDAKGLIPQLSERDNPPSPFDDPDATIALYSNKTRTPRLLVRGGSAAIGDTLHHARIYASQKKDGSFEFNMVRVFAGEFGKIGFMKDGVDLFTEPLPVWSESFRSAKPGLQRAILDGSAKYIGWITQGDEIEFGEDMSAVVPIGPIPNLTDEALYEKRWVVTGFEDNNRVNLAATFLAAEGLPDETPTSERKLLEGNFWRASMNKVFSSEVTVLRRTSLGKPRWKSTQGLPACWNPMQEAQRVFSDESVADH